MAVYAIGDVQGCFRSLEALLRRIRFEPGHDQLWFVGDLVNRGPDSLRVVRFVRSQGDAARVVLGNHDLNLLAIAAGVRRRGKRNTLGDLLAAEDRNDLLGWLRGCPLLVEDPGLGISMVHAGILPQWSCKQAAALAREVEAALRSQDCATFLRHMYGDRPRCWRDSLADWDRLRLITNILTRMRYCDQQGRVDLSHTGPPGTQPEALKPWFAWPRKCRSRLVFGHWSALGVVQMGDVVCLDSGCVWGNELTAARLDKIPIEFTAVRCDSARR